MRAGRRSRADISLVLVVCQDINHILICSRSLAGADPRFVERGGAAATASATGAKVFGGSHLKTLFGISKGGARAPCPPPLNPLVTRVTVSSLAASLQTCTYRTFISGDNNLNNGDS